MSEQFRVIVIGGGVVGCSVLYHLAKRGWSDICLLERDVLTSGSTWHAAGGFHTLNGDPNVAKMQQYTVNLYKEIEEISGQSCGVHITGGFQLAKTRERVDAMKNTRARGRYMGMELEMVTPKDAKAQFPILDDKQFLAGLWDPIYQMCIEDADEPRLGGYSGPGQNKRQYELPICWFFQVLDGRRAVFHEI